jgi:hypothetical protein
MGDDQINSASVPPTIFLLYYTWIFPTRSWALSLVLHQGLLIETRFDVSATSLMTLNEIPQFIMSVISNL